MIEIFSPPRIVLHAVRQGLCTTTPTNLDLTEDWDATTVTGRDRLSDIQMRQKPWMTALKPPCAPFLNMFRLNERRNILKNKCENTRICLGIARSGHVGCVDPSSDGQEISVRTSDICVVMEYRDGLPCDWAQRSDARNSRSVYVGDG